MADVTQSAPAALGEIELDPELEEYKRQIGAAYHIIMTDPRYTRTVNKVAPSFFTKEKLKRQVDPSKVPLVGTVVKGYRSKRIENHKDSLKETQKSGSASSIAMTSAVQNMEHNMDAEAKKRHIGLAVGIAFSIVPISVVAPGAGNAAGSAVGSAGGQLAGQAATAGTNSLAQKGIQKGAQKAGESSSLRRMDTATFESKVHSKFSKTKAFLLYVGAPRTEDPLYARWESSRMLLKSTYGAKEEEDLAQMEPTDEQKKELEEVEKDDDRTFDLEGMGVSLLWIFWRLYECWDLFYYEYLDEKRKGSKENREKYVEELRAREREEDERYLKQLSISEFPTVRKVHKTEIDYVVEMMVHTYWEHPFMDMFGKKQEEKRELMLLFWKNTCETYLKDQEIWCIENPSNLEIQAVAFVQPAENTSSTPLSATTIAKITKKIGIRGTRQMASNYKEREKLATAHAGRGVQVIVYVGDADTDFTPHSCVTSLVKSLILRNDSPPTYVHEKGGGQKWGQFWQMCGFERKMDVMKGENIFWHQN